MKDLDERNVLITIVMRIITIFNAHSQDFPNLTLSLIFSTSIWGGPTEVGLDFNAWVWYYSKFAKERTMDYG